MITLILIIDANRNILIRYYFCAWFSINLNGKKKIPEQNKILFLRFKIYDCSDPVGNLRPKNVVCRNSVSFVKQSYDRVYDLRPFVKQCLVVGLFMFWISWVSQLFFVLFWFYFVREFFFSRCFTKLTEFRHTTFFGRKLPTGSEQS
jgi:hypothetical protein